ncbi:VOC family protein [Streptococcus merionis]|uniref:VOC family protein n=1 Tax=Streptococcus merionis TaxID=400065 RepID=UPI0026F1CEBC|nr:VOC family protein [Streptococcus merionis]
MKIEHAALYVRDLEATKVFFETYFGAQAGDKYHNQETSFQSYFLTFDSGARLEIMTREDLVDLPKELTRVGFAHLAFSLGSRDAVDKLTDRLLADGYHHISGPRVTGDGYYESCILDAEGNQIELTV